MVSVCFCWSGFLFPNCSADSQKASENYSQFTLNSSLFRRKGVINGLGLFHTMAFTHPYHTPVPHTEGMAELPGECCGQTLEPGIVPDPRLRKQLQSAPGNFVSYAFSAYISISRQVQETSCAQETKKVCTHLQSLWDQWFST